MSRRSRRLAAPAAVLLTALLVFSVVAVAFAALTAVWSRAYIGPYSYWVGDVPWVVASRLNAVSGISGTRAWAVGSIREWADEPMGADPTGTIRPFVASTSDGLAWTTTTLSGQTGNLVGVCAVDETHVWAVGEAGLIVMWNGSAWVPQTSNTNANLRAVAFSSTTNGWAVGDGGTIRHTVDGGANWTNSTSGTTAALYGVAAPASDLAFAGGELGAMRKWNGSAWSAQASGTTSNLRSVQFLDTTHGWAVGDSDTFLRWVSASSTWSAATAPPYPGMNSSDMRPASASFSDATNGVAVGYYSLVWTTSDGGSTWHVSRLPADVGPDANTTVSGVWSVPGAPSSVWAVGSNKDYNDTTPDAYVFRGELTAAPATTGTLTGTVTSGGLGVGGVSVTVGSMPSAITAADGTYTVTGINPATYSVVFSKTGYVPQTRTGVQIVADQTEVRDVALVSSSDPVPVYRFYNLKKGVHFYTANVAEMLDVLNSFSSIYRFEGIAYTVDAANPANSTPLYRFYNLKQGVHFYTANNAEMLNVLNNYKSIYRFEGIAYYVATTSTGTTPVYRFFNLKQGVHFYTANNAEMLNVLNNYKTVYRFEGIGYYFAAP